MKTLGILAVGLIGIAGCSSKEPKPAEVKEVSIPTFGEMEIVAPEQFEDLLGHELSLFEGHDEHWYYMSRSKSGDTMIRAMICKIAKENVTKDRMRRLVREKKLESKVDVSKYPRVREYEAWSEKTPRKTEMD